MEVKKKLSWKDNWIENSPAPMTEMFYRLFHRKPTDEELKEFIRIFVIPRSDKIMKQEFEEFKQTIEENDRQRTEEI